MHSYACFSQSPRGSNSTRVCRGIPTVWSSIYKRNMRSLCRNAPWSSWRGRNMHILFFEEFCRKDGCTFVKSVSFITCNCSCLCNRRQNCKSGEVFVIWLQRIRQQHTIRHHHPIQRHPHHHHHHHHHLLP